MKQIKLGFADYTTLVFIPDPASTDGSGKTGLAAANLTVSYTRVETDNDVVVTDVTSSLNDLAALTTAHTDWGLKEVSNTLAPGLYRLDIADAVFASGAWSAVVYVMITSSAAAASPIEFSLIAYDPLDTVRLGLTALPNAAAEAAGGLYTRGTGAGQINQAANGQVDTNITHAAGTAWGSGAITAASIATGAIDADAIADNAIDAGAIAANAITSAKIATGAIAAATFAAGAIDAAALAADAGTEIATAVWASGTRSLTVIDEDSTTLDLNATILAAIGMATGNLDTQLADIEGKVDDLETRLGTPSDLGSGATVAANLVDIEGQTDNLSAIETKIDTIDTNVDSILADTGTDGVVVAAASKTGYTLSTAGLAAFFTSDSGEAYGDAVAGSVVKEIADNAGGSALTVQDIVDGVWDEDATGHQSAGTFGLAIGDPGASTETLYKAIVTDPAGTNIAADIIAIKAETASILTDTAEIGAAGAGLTNINLPDQTMNITGNITGNLSGSVGSVTGNVGGNVTGSVGSLAAQAKADVNAEADTALVDYAAATLEGSLTRDGAQKIILAASAGKVSGAETTEVTIRDTADAVDRIVATVDADGNRSAVTLDAS